MEGEFYVVFDNAMALGHLDDRFRFRWAGARLAVLLQAWPAPGARMPGC